MRHSVKAGDWVFWDDRWLVVTSSGALSPFTWEYDLVLAGQYLIPHNRIEEYCHFSV